MSDIYTQYCAFHAFVIYELERVIGFKMKRTQNLFSHIRDIYYICIGFVAYVYLS